MIFFFLKLPLAPVFYKQFGEAKMPYLAQYSVVCEDVPVRISWISMKSKAPIKNILTLLNVHFKAFLINVFLVEVVNTSK